MEGDPGVRPAGGGIGAVQESTINTAFVLFICSFHPLLFLCLWRALEYKATGERGLFTKLAQSCSVSAPHRIWLFSILIMLCALVAGGHTTFEGVYLTNPLSPERSSSIAEL